MRHNKKINHLGRTASHRKALMANMACSLIEHKRITTTVAKAKALKMYVEPLITKSKEDTTHSRRIVFSYLKQKEAVTELFREIAPKIADRPGGYCRILKTGFRQGDAADMCIIELVDFNETYTKEGGKAAAKPKTRRSRAGSGAGAAKKTAAAEETAVAETETPAEKPAKKAPAKKAPAKKAAEKTDEAAKPAEKKAPAKKAAEAKTEAPAAEKVETAETSAEETPAEE